LRLDALTRVLLGLLTVVAIELDRDENAQLIFETLNGRNTRAAGENLVAASRQPSCGLPLTGRSLAHAAARPPPIRAMARYTSSRNDFSRGSSA
jgi:hypothetical protein